jgi:hypothetical protein
MVVRKVSAASLAIVCLSLAIAVPFGWQSLNAESEPPPEPTTEQLAENAKVALSKLMARISIEDGGATTGDNSRTNRSRVAAGEAMLSVLEAWKKQLVKSASAPITTGMDNQQQISLSILSKMSPESDEIEMLVNNVATFSEYPIHLSDNPWQEYPYCRALWIRQSNQALLGHYRAKPSNKVSELEVKLVAGILESCLGNKNHRRANLAEPLLKYERGRDLTGNIGRIEKQWQKIAEGDSGVPAPSDRPMR